MKDWLISFWEMDLFSLSQKKKREKKDNKIYKQKKEKSKTSEISIDRASALEMSDVVITGVPNKSFPKIQLSEIKSGTICLNFSTVQNFEPDITEKSSMFIPRVGPVTVAMCMRNALRLYENFHR